MSLTIPAPLESLFASAVPTNEFFTSVMEQYGRSLTSDRSLLFLREPNRRQTLCAHGWWRLPEFAFPLRSDWSEEAADLPALDPMYAAALRDPAALYIDNVETAGSEILNLEFEQRDFGHSALIHAPLYAEGQMIGILEPCMFGQPRAWTPFDRLVTHWIQEKLAPLVAAYIQAQFLSLDTPKTIA